MYPLAHSKLCGQADSHIGSAWGNAFNLRWRTLCEAPEQTGASCAAVKPCLKRAIGAIEQDGGQRETIDGALSAVVCTEDRGSVRVADVIELQAKRGAAGSAAP